MIRTTTTPIAATIVGPAAAVASATQITTVAVCDWCKRTHDQAAARGGARDQAWLEASAHRCGHLVHDCGRCDDGISAPGHGLDDDMRIHVLRAEHRKRCCAACHELGEHDAFCAVASRERIAAEVLAAEIAEDNRQREAPPAFVGTVDELAAHIDGMLTDARSNATHAIVNRHPREAASSHDPFEARIQEGERLMRNMPDRKIDNRASESFDAEMARRPLAAANARAAGEIAQGLASAAGPIVTVTVNGQPIIGHRKNLENLAKALDPASPGGAMTVEVTHVGTALRPELRDEVYKRVRAALAEEAEQFIRNRSPGLHMGVRGSRTREREEHETAATISAWADATFGPVKSNVSIAVRSLKEVAELIAKLVADDTHPGAPEEVADVVIVLQRLMHRMGYDLATEVDRKMEINRAREWTLDGNGHGQHK